MEDYEAIKYHLFWARFALLTQRGSVLGVASGRPCHRRQGPRQTHENEVRKETTMD